MNFRTMIRQILKESITETFQSGTDNFSDRGFERNTPLITLAKLKQAYGEPRVEKILYQMKKNY